MKRDDQAEKEFEQMMQAAKEGKRIDVNDGRNVIGTNRGLVVSADVIEGGINYQA